MSLGIPPLLNTASQAVANLSLLKSDASEVLNLFSSLGPQWGIFLGDDQALEPDSIVQVDYKNESRIADYPMERGAFESYNKVSTPFSVQVRMTKGGSLDERSQFLDSLQAVAASLSLYDVVTPEKVYLSVNIERNDYRRSATHGLGLITVDVWLTEIRETVIPVYTATGAAPVASAPSSPSGASPINAGTVQPQLPAATQISQLQSSIVGPVTDTLSNAIVNAAPAMESAVGNLSSTLTETLSNANLSPALEGAMTNLNTALTASGPSMLADLQSALPDMSSAMSGFSGQFPQVVDAMKGLGESLPSTLNINFGGH